MANLLNEIPQEEIENSLRSAISQIYKLGYPQYLKLEYDDVWQDAQELLLKSSGREPRNACEVYYKILRRLIDRYRQMSGVRKFKEKGLPLPKLVFASDFVNMENKRVSPFDNEAIIEWQESEGERYYEIECDGKKFRVSNVDLETTIKSILDDFPREMKTAVYCVYFKNQTLRQAGRIIGVTESRVSQILKQFRRVLKRSLVANI